MFAFAASGFAPFAFSPIAFAIEELIEELREELHGGGGRRGRNAPQARRPTRAAAQRRSDDSGLTEELVRAQWDLLELRQRLQAQDQAEQAAAAAAARQTATLEPQKPAPVAIAERAAPAATALREPANRPDSPADDLALLLLLSEV